MTQQELEQFIQEYKIDHQIDEEKDDLIIFLSIYELEQFQKMIDPHFTAHEAHPLFMKGMDFCTHLKRICDYHEIDLKKVKDNINKQYDKTRN